MEHEWRMTEQHETEAKHGTWTQHHMRHEQHHMTYPCDTHNMTRTMCTPSHHITSHLHSPVSVSLSASSVVLLVVVVCVSVVVRSPCLHHSPHPHQHHLHCHHHSHPHLPLPHSAHTPPSASSWLLRVNCSMWRRRWRWRWKMDRHERSCWTASHTTVPLTHVVCHVFMFISHATER